MDILCVGDMLADLIIREVDDIVFDNTATQIEETSLKPGGDALNNSIDMSRLGNQVSLIGKLGCDIFGDYLHEECVKKRSGYEPLRKKHNSASCKEYDPDAQRRGSKVLLLCWLQCRIYH